jgi:hypothetical protein
MCDLPAAFVVRAIDGLAVNRGAGKIKRGSDTVKRQTTSGATPVLPPAQPSAKGSTDTATLELLSGWRLEDSSPTPDQVRAAEDELREFKRAMNENRASTGESILYP